MTSVQAIKAFFEADGGRKVSMEELRVLSGPERQELGQLCCKALGVEYQTVTGKAA